MLAAFQMATCPVRTSGMSATLLLTWSLPTTPDAVRSRSTPSGALEEFVDHLPAVIVENCHQLISHLGA